MPKTRINQFQLLQSLFFLEYFDYMVGHLFGRFYLRAKHLYLPTIINVKSI